MIIKTMLAASIFCMIFSITCDAQDVKFCKNICLAEKTRCRKGADEQARIDDSAPLFVQSAPKQPQDNSTVKENKEIRTSEANKGKSERYQACENDHRHCEAACASPSPSLPR